MTRKTKIIWTVAALVAIAGIAYAAVGGGQVSLSQRVNAGFDDLEAVNARVFELPALFLFTIAAMVAAVGVIAAERVAFGKVLWKRTLLASLVLAAFIGLAIHADSRIEGLKNQLNKMKDQLGQSRFINDPPAETAIDPATTSQPSRVVTPVARIDGDLARVPAAIKPAKRTTFMFDRTAAQSALRKTFGSTELRPTLYDQAIDYVQVNLTTGPAVAYLAIVDLKLPGVQVKLGGTTAAKTFTSDFAMNNGCTIAINGEAGLSPAANSGLGSWTGHFVSAGRVILTELKGNPRPFLSFDKTNSASFIPQLAQTRDVPSGAYNVMWGRLDAIVNGDVQTDPERNRQPRTAMALNQDGSRLFLMVVDGRQRGYSIGFTRAEVGEFLKAFGAYNGMLCDEGGSSCMYARNWRGIVNYPSDGEERATYTHFGVVTPK